MGDCCSQQSQAHGYRAGLKYFLLFTTMLRNLSLNHHKVRTPCLFSPSLPQFRRVLSAPGFSFTANVLLTRRNGIAWKRKHLCGKAQVAKFCNIPACPGQCLWALNTLQAECCRTYLVSAELKAWPFLRRNSTEELCSRQCLLPLPGLASQMY